MNFSLLPLMIVIVCIYLFFIWAVHPAFDSKRRMKPYLNMKFAHRGLWDDKHNIPENSMGAFKRAVDSGYAIELDVHLTADKRLVVFHDSSLSRMCSVNGSVEELTWDELSGLKLQGTVFGIPLFEDVLSLVDGRVPLLIEIKQPSVDTAVCAAVYDMLKGYKGQYLIESFNPFALSWFKKHAPNVLRGQLASSHSQQMSVPYLLRLASSSLVVNLLSRPNFIAYDMHANYGMGYRLNRYLYRVPFFAWTVRSNGEYERVLKEYDGIIFEKILPEIKEKAFSSMSWDNGNTKKNMTVA